MLTRASGIAIIENKVFSLPTIVSKLVIVFTVKLSSISSIFELNAKPSAAMVWSMRPPDHPTIWISFAPLSVA